MGSTLFNVNYINTHFQSINTDPNYIKPAQLVIMEHHKFRVIHEISVFNALPHVKRIATDPDDLPFAFGRRMPWNSHLG